MAAGFGLGCLLACFTLLAYVLAYFYFYIALTSSYRSAIFITFLSLAGELYCGVARESPPIAALFTCNCCYIRV